MSAKPALIRETREGSCPQPGWCPLSRVRAGAAVRVKRLPEGERMVTRLREIGVCEEAVIRLIARQAVLICQVCQGRLAVSAQLAEHIWVEAMPAASAT